MKNKIEVEKNKSLIEMKRNVYKEIERFEELIDSFKVNHFLKLIDKYYLMIESHIGTMKDYIEKHESCQYENGKTIDLNKTDVLIIDEIIYLMKNGLISIEDTSFFNDDRLIFQLECWIKEEIPNQALKSGKESVNFPPLSRKLQKFLYKAFSVWGVYEKDDQANKFDNKFFMDYLKRRISDDKEFNVCQFVNDMDKNYKKLRHQARETLKKISNAWDGYLLYVLPNGGGTVKKLSDGKIIFS